MKQFDNKFNLIIYHKHRIILFATPSYILFIFPFKIKLSSLTLSLKKEKYENKHFMFLIQENDIHRMNLTRYTRYLNIRTIYEAYALLLNIHTKS